MSAGTVTQVTTGKRGIDGGIYVAPSGTSLPTTATETLNSAFKNIGYISEDGVTNSLGRTSEDIKEWGGDVVETINSEQTDDFKFKAIEALNTELLKAIYGSSNVTASTTIAVSVKNADPASMCWCIDIAQKGGKLKRIVIPNGKITAIGDIVYKANEAVGYDLTVRAGLDSSGYTHYEYISAGTT